MNKLAEELNEVLKGTVAERLFSDFGKRIYFPKGIVAQGAEAKKHAKRFNATVGMAYAGGEPLELPSLKRYIPELNPAEAVSYAPTPGDEELRKLWKGELVKKNEDLKGKSFSLPMVVPGLTSGITQIADLFVDKDDQVVLPDMYWGNYRLILEERRCARIKSFPFFTEGGKLNISAMAEAIKSGSSEKGKVVLLLNFPNNPTGYSPTVAEAEEITSTIKSLADKGDDILIINDDAYFGLFYEENTYKQSLFASLCSIHDNVLAVKVDGATKEDFAWGFRIGFLTFGSPGLKEEHYQALEKKLMGAVRSSVSNSSRLSQSLLKKVMLSPTYYEEKAKYFEMLKERYLEVKKVLSEGEREESLVALPFNSGYFMSFRVRGVNADELRKELLYKEGVGTIAIQDTHLRVAYSSVDKENIRNLYELIFSVAKRISL
ncbi:MAG: aminotransferase class I/II [Spirochaetes bacterium]|nr:MAG: aminotransferase class I/II [Spirochaetota bacterium]